MPRHTSSSSFLVIGLLLLRNAASQTGIPPLPGIPLLPGLGNLPGSLPTLPFLPTLLGGGAPCNGTRCGRGSCIPSLNATFGFVCECEPGWRQARPDTDRLLLFLPCIVPNCTINYGCSGEDHATDTDAAPQLPSIQTCTYDGCGSGGICNQTSAITHDCICKDGFQNLMNDTIFPCYKQCSFGPECPALSFNNTISLPMPNSLLDFNRGSSLKSAGYVIAALLTSLVWPYA